MNLLLLEPHELDARGRVVLRDRRAQHLLAVLEVSVGTRVRAGVVRGPVGNAEVLEVRDEQVELRVELPAAAEPPPDIDLVLALPRPKVLSRVLQTVAAWGVRRVDLINAWRVEKSYFSSPRLQPATLARDLRLGCEQGGLTWVPELLVHRRLLPFLDAELAPRLARDPPEHRLIAHPGAAKVLEEVVDEGQVGRTTVAVGPEGGWIEPELRSFAELGFQAVSTGPRILRVEVVVSAIFAELALLRRLRAGGGLGYRRGLVR